MGAGASAMAFEVPGMAPRCTTMSLVETGCRNGKVCSQAEITDPKADKPAKTMQRRLPRIFKETIRSRKSFRKT